MTKPRTLRAARRAALALAFLGLAPLARADDTPTPQALPQPQAQPEPQPLPATRPDQAVQYKGMFDGAFGVRPALADVGVNVDVELQVDVRKVTSGGLNTRDWSPRTLFEPVVSIDTDKAFGLPGGRVFVDFQLAQGANASDRLVGDVQGVDALDAPPGVGRNNRVQLAQLWYEQKLFGDVLRLKVGKVDANSEFDRATNGLEFFNQSTGSDATLFSMPTYPDAATAVNVFLKPDAQTQVGFGLYDGSFVRGVPTGATGPRTFFRDPHDLYFIAEIDRSFAVGPDKLPGRVGVGGWYQTDRFARFDGRTADGSGGPYALLDQSIWRPAGAADDDARGVGGFLLYGYADPSLSPIDHSAVAGVQWTGALDFRPADVVGAGVDYAHLSAAGGFAHDHEVAYEAFYRLQLTPFFALKPDVQYVQDPGGRRTPDAVVFDLRFDVNF